MKQLMILIIIINLCIYIHLVLREEPVFEQKLNQLMRTLNDIEKFKIQSVKNLNTSTISNRDAKFLFFQILASPMQSFCRVLKRFGGVWQGIQVDGDKFVCLDNLLAKDKCIIYSFGISNEWSFEDLMDSIGFGCKIFAYDHTIDNIPSKRGHGIYYFKTGLGIGENLKTLTELIEANQHQNTEIDYLKIDIEAAEFSEGGFSNWINSGALNNVRQIALELHIYQNEKNQKQYNELLDLLKVLYNLGYVVISQEVNMVFGPRDPDGLYNLLEVVFMKV